MAGEKKFGTAMFGFKRSDVNAYFERIIREFDQRLKEKDEENAMLKFQIKELTAKYEQLSQEAESLVRNKEKIAGVLIQAQEKAEAMMEEARGYAVAEKARLDQLLESEREKIVDIRRDLKILKNQIAGIISRYQQEINETLMNIEQKELYYTVEETHDKHGDSEIPDETENENQQIPDDGGIEIINAGNQEMQDDGGIEIINDGNQEMPDDGGIEIINDESQEIPDDGNIEIVIDEIQA